jgi:hypothetical protein
MLWDRPTLGLAFGAGLGLNRRVTEHLEVGVAAAGPIVVGQNWGTPEGAASVRHELGWVEGRLNGLNAGPLVLGASLGAGVFRTEVQGIRPADLSAGNQVWSFAALLAGHAELPLGGNAALGVTLRAIALTPRPAVGIGESVAVIQLPLLGVSTGLLVGF